MAVGKRLPKSWFESDDVLGLARDLIGKVLFTRINGITTGGIIVETEAYRGPEDRASHAYNDRRTPRTEVMYSSGGVMYIYLCYGIHHLSNVITGPKDSSHAILIRALQPYAGVEFMAQRRRMDPGDARLTKGPGALSVAMGLTVDWNGTSLVAKQSPIWIEDRGITYAPEEICQSKRIGVESAGDAAHWPWRFFVKSNRYVSAHRRCE